MKNSIDPNLYGNLLQGLVLHLYNNISSYYLVSFIKMEGIDDTEHYIYKRYRSGLP